MLPTNKRAKPEGDTMTPELYQELIRELAKAVTYATKLEKSLGLYERNATLDSARLLLRKAQLT